jgi:hypothetical protein
MARRESSPPMPTATGGGVRVTPLDKPKRAARPVALVEPGIDVVRVHTDDGATFYRGPQVAPALEALAGHVVYCNAPVARMRHTCDARRWVARVWRERSPTAMRLERTIVRPLRGALDSTEKTQDASGSTENAWNELKRFLAWVEGYGVHPASLGTIGWNLWRSSLPSPVSFDADPAVTTPAVFGGRQEARPKRYRHMTAWDLSAAYPTAMTSQPYGSHLRRAAGFTAGDLSTELAGIAHASVIVPETLPYGPLPMRLDPRITDLVWYGHGTYVGSWPIRELALARDLGVFVRVREAWVPSRHVEPFGPWWQLVIEGRALGGGAGHLVKQSANLLWGAFAMSGAVTEWTWETRHGTGAARFLRSEADRQLPHARARHIAAETTARVRGRLLTEALYGIPYSPVHVDTDGVVVRSSCPAPEPAGDGPGQWRSKGMWPTVDVRAPQVYRHTCPDCALHHRRWHYVTSGVPADSAEEVWRLSVGRVMPELETPTGERVKLTPFDAHRRRIRRQIEQQKAMAAPLERMFVKQ